MVRLQEAPIDPAVLIHEVQAAASGAVALFLGTVREHNEGRRVHYLEYHAYPEMVRVELERLEREALERFEVAAAAVVHRIGRLQIGDVAVAVAVAAAHRDPAFRACRYLIDTLKHRVPIWKKEYFEGGECWIEGPGAPD